MSERARREAYWRQNLKVLAGLLAVWFVVSYGCSILFVDVLDRVQVGGFGLGFWFAQQGSIYVFVVLILVYVRVMNRLDREFGVDERDEDRHYDMPGDIQLSPTHPHEQPPKPGDPGAFDRRTDGED